MSSGLAMFFARAFARYPGLATSAQQQGLRDQPSVVAASGENRPGGAGITAVRADRSPDRPSDPCQSCRPFRRP